MLKVNYIIGASIMLIVVGNDIVAMVDFKFNVFINLWIVVHPVLVK